MSISGFTPPVITYIGPLPIQEFMKNLGKTLQEISEKRAKIYKNMLDDQWAKVIDIKYIKTDENYEAFIMWEYKSLGKTLRG